MSAAESWLPASSQVPKTEARHGGESGQALPALLLAGCRREDAGDVKVSWRSGREKGRPEGARQPAATIPGDGFACGKKYDACAP